MKTNSKLAAVYGCAGVPVFPCREAGERTKAPYVAHGYHEASAEPAALKHWATIYPGALYGLPCAPNGLLVLDADRHGNGDGVANLMALFARHSFDEQSVPAIRTPRDGLHCIFEKPTGLGKTKGRIADAVDVRDNGYIIAPGTLLPDGRRYDLLNGTVEQLAFAIANQTVPFMPEWLVALALQPYSAPMPFEAPVHIEGVTNQLGGLVRTIIGAPIGNRNRALYWAACRLGGLVAHGLVGNEAASALLVAAGLRAGLGTREAQATAVSGLRQGRIDTSHGR